jgi:hypothetical protein
MSVLPLKADIRQREWRVRYVPEADIACELVKGQVREPRIRERMNHKPNRETVCRVRGVCGVADDAQADANPAALAMLASFYPPSWSLQHVRRARLTLSIVDSSTSALVIQYQ